MPIFHSITLNNYEVYKDYGAAIFVGSYKPLRSDMKRLTNCNQVQQKTYQNIKSLVTTKSHLSAREFLLNIKPVSSMKAMVYQRYGEPEVVHLQELEKPIPDDHEVLIKIHATSVTAGDCRMRSFTVPRWQWLPARLYLGVFRPRRKILGMELAGVIEAIGKKVTRFKVGDAVFASTFEVNFGAHAEYKSMPEDGLIAPKP